MRFVAEVLHHGQPDQDATVTVTLSPTADDQFGGSAIQLQHEQGGRYVGEATLSHSGEWQALVTVQGPQGHSGTALYRLQAPATP
jgi:hypothetical protein